jgi:hypothetical protein
MRALLDFLAQWFRDATAAGPAGGVAAIPVIAEGAAGRARAKVPLRAG